jgi:hypothetical protein
MTLPPEAECDNARADTRILNNFIYYTDGFIFYVRGRRNRVPDLSCIDLWFGNPASLS